MSDDLSSEFVEFERIFDEHCAFSKQLFERKSRNYNVSFRRMGVLGVACDVNGICGKLQNMLYRYIRTGELDLEKVSDALTDLHNYANIGKICLEEENYIGIEHKAG